MASPRSTGARRALPLVLILTWLASCAASGRSAGPGTTRERNEDPARGEVPLPCADGWTASLVLENGETGVWTVGAFPVFEQYAVPEVVALDDLGRCHVCISYSGKWTALPRVHDGRWLGGLAHGDVDQRIAGPELYTGGQAGNLYQLVPHRQGVVDSRLVAYLPGREIHTILAGELDPSSPGAELLVFTRPGELFRVTPTGPDGRFETRSLGELPGRVRDARVLPGDGGTPRIATVGRAGSLEILTLSGDGLRRETVHSESMGMGRLALGRGAGPLVLYVTLDDGRVLRLQEERSGAWSVETIRAGPQGLRGIAVGRFHEDPDVESVATFGYSGRVELLTRTPAGDWTVETLFEDRDRGHWLSAAELDGRNGTDELLGSGYGGRVFVLARPPGYASGRAAVRASGEPAGARPPRVAVRASASEMEHLSPLSYRGGFQPKTMVYETLVTRDAGGRIAPGLAARWEVGDGGRTFRFWLREGARYHDGAPVDAESVRVHFARWVGLPEHAWLGASERIRAVVAESERVVRVELDEPYALLSDLCAINPCALRGPGSLDGEGNPVRPVGSGPFELLGAVGEGTFRFRYACVGPEDEQALLDVVVFQDDRGPLERLLEGSVDAIVDGWYEAVPRARLAELAELGLDVREGPGSSVWYLSFGLEGVTASVGARQWIAAAVGRAELVERVEHGRADEAWSWAAPSIRDWRRPAWPAVPPPHEEIPTRLRLLVNASVPREVALGRVLTEQLARFMDTELVVDAVEDEVYAERLARREFDLRIERTWGVPYDPLISLRARFLPRDGAACAPGGDEHLAELVRRASAVPLEEGRLDLYRRIQTHMDREALIVPLLVPRRLAALSPRLDRPRLALDHDLYRTDLVALLECREPADRHCPRTENRERTE